jgi:hypothetical protein
LRNENVLHKHPGRYLISDFKCLDEHATINIELFIKDNNARRSKCYKTYISVREKVFSIMQMEFNRPILACDRIGRPIYLASPEIFLAEPDRA